MSLNKQKWRFVQALVQDAPEHGGVYVLWAGDKVICIGRAEGGRDTVRGCLTQLLESRSGEAQHATHYSWELCRNPLRVTAGPSPAPPGNGKRTPCVSWSRRRRIWISCAGRQIPAAATNCAA